jgi:predicted GH43/DUF377 family glycosyl hydrolase
MKHPPLNATRQFTIWPHFSPGEWLDFNPSLVTLGNGQKLALIRRNQIPPVPGVSTIWSVPVDDDLTPTGQPTLLIALGEDPRGVAIGNRLFVFYVVIDRDATGRITGSSMKLAEFDVASTSPRPLGVYGLPRNPTGNPDLVGVTWEKNWVPFVTPEQHIALIYSHTPWTVLVLDVSVPGSTPKLVTAYRGDDLAWNYGQIRGGSTPVRYDDEHLITFFHSCQVIGSRNVYMVGACVFRNEPPYSPRLITCEPLLVAPYRSTVARFGWPVLASVIFPVGLDHSTDAFRLLCGLDDGEIGMFSIFPQELADRLSPLPPPTSRTLTDRDGNSTPLAPGLTWLSSGASTVKERLPLARFLGMLPAQDATFIDIGAGEGLFSIYLAENFSHVMAYESAAFSDLRTNLAVNGIAHAQAIDTALPAEDDAVWSRDDVALLRIDATDPYTILRRAEKLLETSRPLLFIQAFASPEDEAACASLLAQHGYTIQHVFALMPQCAIAATEAHPDRYPWLL